MNIDKILGRIQDDARQYAAQTLESAREKAAQMEEQAAEDRARDHDTALSEAAAEAGDMRDRMMRMAALDMRKETLAAKREMIDEAFIRALAEMRGMGPAQARGFHIKLLLEAAGGGEKLIIAAEDEALFDAGFFAEANAAMEAAGKPGRLSLSMERRPLDGGFVLEQEGMEVNCTYESVLRTRRAGLEAEVAAALFA